MTKVPRTCQHWRALATLAVSLSVAPLVACGADEPVLTDADVVFCLSDDQRSELADAAVNLGLAGPAPEDEKLKVDGWPMAVTRWREQRPKAFTRACSAIRPARPPESSSGFPPAVLTWLLTLVTAVVAAVLGFTSAYLLQRTARTGQNGRLLRSATTAFLAAARAYARDWEGGPERPSDLAVQDRRGALMAELHLVAAQYPESPASSVVTTLSTTLSEQVFRQWPRQDHDQVTRELATLEKTVTALADMIEHPWRDRDKLQGKVAVAPRGGA